MATLKEIARTFALGFSAGYFSKHDITRWADDVLATQTSAHLSIVDLSLSGESRSFGHPSYFGLVFPELRNQAMQKNCYGDYSPAI
jgi:hypothetical protein